MGKRIIPQRRGKGSTIYRSPSHRHKGQPKYPRGLKGEGKIVDLFHAPGRTSPMAKVKYDTEQFLIIAPEGIRVGQTVQAGSGSPIELGNILPIGEISEGTMIYNIEAVPGDGGKFIKTAGTSGMVVSRGKDVMVQMPSGVFKPFNPRCRATVGIVAGSGRTEKPFAKAGKKYHTYRSKAKKSFKVKGIAMNPVNHPHGGGNHPHVGTQSSVSWHAPPGRKVGNIAPKKKTKKNRRK